MLSGNCTILIKQEAGWAPEPDETFFGKQNLLFLLEFKPRTLQPIARGYINYLSASSVDSLKCIDIFHFWLKLGYSNIHLHEHVHVFLHACLVQGINIYMNEKGFKRMFLRKM